MPRGKPSKSPVFINSSQRLLAYDWVTKNITQERLDKTGEDTTQLSKLMEKELGFPIAPWTVGELIKHKGLKTEAMKRSEFRKSDVTSRIDALERQMKHLYEKMGEPLPE